MKAENKMKMEQIERAFTLVELLIVVAIIMILMSILIPALGTVKQTALATACKSNQKQAAIAIISYAHDYDGVAVLFSYRDGVSGSSRSWMEYVTGRDGGGDYLVDKNVAVCPAEAPYKYENDKAHTYAGRTRRSADPDATFRPDSTFSVGSNFVTLAKIPKSVDYQFIFDSYDTRFSKQMYTTYHFDGNDDRPYIHTRHRRKANIVFADGHVEDAEPGRLKEININGGYNQQKIAVPF